MADNNERIKQIKQEDAIQRNLSKILQDRITQTGKLTKAQKELVDSTIGSQDIEGKILAVQEKKEEVLKRVAKFNRQADKDLLSQLDTAEKYLDTEKQVKDNKEKQKNIQQDLTDNIKEQLGYSSELADLFAAGGVMALGAKAFSSALDAGKESMTATFNKSTELYKSLGISAGEAASLSGDMQMAATTSLLYDMEDMASAAGALSDRFGTTQNITKDMLKDVAEITSLTGDAASATDLAVIFDKASGDAGQLTSEIKDIAQGVGVNASAVMKDMAANQRMMLNMTKDEVKELAKKTAELVKQGLSISKMRDMSDAMLDIESSMKAQQKARQMGLGEMMGDTEAMRAAAAEIQYGDATKGAEMMAAEIKKAGLSTEKFGSIGHKQQEILAKTYGMSADELGKMVQTQEENANLTAKYGDTMGTLIGSTKAFAATGLETFKTMGIELAKLIAQYAVMNMMQGKGGKLGMGSLMGGKGGGKSKSVTPSSKGPAGGVGGGMMDSMSKINMKAVLKGAAAMVIVAAAVFVFGKAVQEFMKVSWEAVGMAVVSMLALVGAVALLGLALSGPQALFIIAGAAAMLIIAAALFVLGKAIQEIAKGFGMFGELTEQLSALVMISPGLIALAAIFAVLGLSMIPFAAGLALITPFLGTLLILGTMLPLLTGALGIGGDSQSSSPGGGGTEDPLLAEIKALRNDLQSQPIQIVVDGKVVSEISKMQNRGNSFSKMVG
tara:strand:+ start:4081 stop:6261 length:2181 start_codon:yes stop_codon:yes gene_type:complete